MRLSSARFALMLGLVAVPLAGAAMVAHAAPTEPEHDAAANAQIVAARQAGFRLTLSAFLGVKAALARGDMPRTLVLPASAMASWGKALPGLFPDGSKTADSNALPSVWSNRAGFAASAATFTAAAAKLAAAAKAGDKDAAAAAFTEVEAACGACHREYRLEEHH